MKTCPNCKTTGIPDEAKFCPNCGTMLKAEEPAKRMTISECRLVPSIIKQGEQCRLVWKGENVSSIIVDDKPYQIYEDIILRPNQSHTYNIAFVDSGGYVNGKVIREQLNVTVKSPNPVIVKESANKAPEKTTRIVFVKDELSRINAYDSDTHNLRIFLNEKCVAYTEMRPYYSKEIVVKMGDVIKLVAQKGDWKWDVTLFEKTISDKMLSKSAYYLYYVKKMFSQEEVDFHVASYA